jgi:hypothetical protein
MSFTLTRKLSERNGTPLRWVRRDSTMKHLDKQVSPFRHYYFMLDSADIARRDGYPQHATEETGVQYHQQQLPELRSYDVGCDTDRGPPRICDEL